MIKYAVSVQLFDHDLYAGEVIEAPDTDPVYKAVLRTFMRLCAVPQHEACRMAKEDAFHVIVFAFLPDGGHRLITNDQVDWPWQQTTSLQGEINRVQNAIANAESFESLKTIPGMEHCSFQVDLAPARRYVQALREQIQQIDQEWAQAEAHPGDHKEQRRIKMEQDECENPTTT